MEEWSIQDIAREAGTTSRTLRYYGEIGLLPASRVGSNGYRYYDRDALIRLQRILLLRELGLGLSAIAEVLDDQQEASPALRTHLELLEQEKHRIQRQITSVRTTLHKIERGEELMAHEVLDGFDHTQYEEEVVRRWGRTAYQNSDQWWRSLTTEEKKQFQQRGTDIATGFAEALDAGESPDGERAQQLAHRHYAWVTTAWGGTHPTREQFTGLGQLYVDDPRFHQNYEGHAMFVRDAMARYAQDNL